MNRVIVTGYFYKHNLGDDTFEYIWNHILQQVPNITFSIVDFDKLKNIPVDSVDTIILAGGNLLLDYFCKHLDKYKHKRILGFSLGMPYKGFCFTSNILDHFDHIECRSKLDTKLLNKCYQLPIAHWTPDISVLLPQIIHTNSNTITLPHFENKLNVGVCLTRPIVNSPNYHDVLKSFATFINEITKTNQFHIFLIPFDTNTKSNTNCDLFINNDLLDLIDTRHVTNITNTLTVPEMCLAFQSLDINICMRFHSIMYSLIYNVPFIPVFTTPKVQELLNDLNYSPSYPLPTENDLPTCLDPNKLLDTFYSVLNKQPLLYPTLNPISIDYFIKHVSEIIHKPIQKHTRTHSLQHLLEIISQEHGKNEIAQIICNYFGSNKYHYGLASKLPLDTLNLTQELEWIWNDTQKH